MTRPSMQVTRHDSVAVSMGATPVEVRPDGSKVYEGTAAFGDVVAPYPDLDPPRNEFRPADEVMSPEALATLEGLRFTGGPRARDLDGRISLPADHDTRLDDPDGLAIEGVVLRGWREDGTGDEPPALRVRVLAYTRAIQSLIEAGVRDLSLGYRTDEERTPDYQTIGTHAGMPYQVVQRRIRYYHLNLVKSARSRTPSGRHARLDAAPHSYPPHATTKKTTNTMKRSPLIVAALAILSRQDPARAVADASTPAPVLDAAGAPRLDAAGAPMMSTPMVDAAGPALSDADAALLKQMSPEAQAALAAYLAPPANAFAEGAEMAEADDAAEEANELATDEAQDAALVDPLAAKIDAILAALEAAGIKVGTGAPVADAGGASAASPLVAAVGAAKMDATKNPTPAAANRQDSAVLTPPTATPRVPTDSATLIANATAAAKAASTAQYNADAAFVGVVRKDGHKADTTGQAAEVMLVTVKTHLPLLAAVAESAVKDARYDALVPLYEQAESLRRDGLRADAQLGLRNVFDRMTLDDGAANRGDGIVRAPA